MCWRLGRLSGRSTRRWLAHTVLADDLRLQRRAWNATQQVISQRLTFWIIDLFVKLGEIVTPRSEIKVVTASKSRELSTKCKSWLSHWLTAIQAQCAFGETNRLWNVTNRLTIQQNIHNVDTNVWQIGDSVCSIVVVDDFDRNTSTTRINQRWHEWIATSRLLIAKSINSLNVECCDLMSRTIIQTTTISVRKSSRDFAR